ncbi:MAG TPA: RNA 2',3'-cyclic phosphodiesterase [Candidatus Methylomirabilis sp.]|nr:RNA 2',3'-cyclic phosphodiesterase [Candidatus Methylomirabilis sp.]
MARVFVALWPDDRTRSEVAEEIDRLRPLCRAIAWVPPLNLHLTLKFLGEQPEPRLADALGGLAEAVEGRAAFSIALHGVGAFPGMERARILWIGVATGALDVRALQSSVDAALAARGFPGDERPWHPHLTVGRVFDPRRWRREATPVLQESIARAATRAFGAFPVSRVSLVRSDLSATGARYSEIDSVSLAGT